MRNMQRNQQTIWYRLYTSAADITATDEWGNTVYTGEKTKTYAAPASMRANVSPASGINMTEQFGSLDNYDKVIVTADMSCPIDENTVLYLDGTPVYDSTDQSWSAYDHVVRRISKSLNGISIAVRKVDVS